MEQLIRSIENKDSNIQIIKICIGKLNNIVDKHLVDIKNIYLFLKIFSIFLYYIEQEFMKLVHMNLFLDYSINVCNRKRFYDVANLNYNSIKSQFTSCLTLMGVKYKNFHMSLETHLDASKHEIEFEDYINMKISYEMIENKINSIILIYINGYIIDRHSLY